MSVQWKMSSPVGDLYIVASTQGLRSLSWTKQAVPMCKSLSGQSAEVKIIARTVKELGEYFLGRRKKFEITLDIDGTVFQKKVWTQLLRIPYGKTSSYKDIAVKLKTKAYRAVGSANGKNPFCIIIPCHRVIASDGTIGGYSGGIKNKEKLLKLEQN